MRKLYDPQANPLARVVQGVPTSWDPNIASTSFSDRVLAVAWSPCSRFIAISQLSSDKVSILNTVTLEQIYTTCPVGQLDGPRNLVFSPDSHLLTGCFNSFPDFIVNWDLQTGGLISKISRATGSNQSSSMTYSGCGTMIGLLFVEDGTITTYNVLSGVCISSHSVEKAVTPTIWTHGEFLRFATVESGSITIWEVGFSSRQPPTKVESLLTPDDFTSREFRGFFPILSWLAFAFEGRVLVWDARHRKIILDSADVTHPMQASFSPDGRFIVCGTVGAELCFWEKSPDGYLLQKFITGGGPTRQIVSPGGESIVTFGGSIVRLWRITDSPTSLSGVSIQSCQKIPRDFLLEFSIGEKLVAVTRRGGSTITVLDLKSGDQRAVVDTGMNICGVGITGSAIVAADDGKVVTWDLLAGDDALNIMMNTNDSVRTNMFHHSYREIGLPHVSVSPDLHHIATKHVSEDLHICNTHTGELLAVVKSMGDVPGFTPDGRVVWCAAMDGKVDRWKITGNGTPDVTKLESLGSADDPPEGFPWRSSHGYQVTDDGWVLSSRKKRLLWLPHHWQSREPFGRMWRGKFLTLLHAGLPLEAVVLELEL